MTAIQFGIGALNDLADEAPDAGRPDKPIPSALVGAGAAWVVVVVAFALGLGLSASISPAVLGVALLGAATGIAYDLWLKGTAWGPVAFAIGVPLLPVYAWLGANGELPPFGAVLIPAAALAGIGLAVGNALVDLERDRDAGTVTPATALGAAAAWRMAAALHVVVIALALSTLLAIGFVAPSGPLVVAGAVSVVSGLGLARSDAAARRERGWELQAIGVGLIAAGWLWAVSGSAA
jgi:4-hydroxybenzoate polyprenyltransferase